MVTVIRNLADTYASEGVPSNRYGTARTLAVRIGGNGQVLTYIKAASAVGRPAGGELAFGILRMFLTANFSGTRTFTARRVTSKFSSLTASWRNRPSQTATNEVTVSVTDGRAGDPVDFPVTQLVLDCLADFGYVAFRIATTSPSGVLTRFHSVESQSAALKPVLILDWVTAPAAPRELVPSGGRAVSKVRPTFLFDYASASRPMSGYQMQLKYGSDDFTTPDLDTGDVASATPSHTWGTDLDTDTPFAWRVKVRDTANDWSEWSVPVWSEVAPKGTLTITSPSTVFELIPPIEWSFSGTQTRFQVLEAGTGNVAFIDDSRVLPGADSSYASDRPLNFFGDPTTTRIVRVWDDVDRAETPGDPAYVEASQVVTLDSSVNVDTVENLTATVTGIKPTPLVSWTYPAVPDGYAIHRDGRVLVPFIDGDEVHDGDDEFSWVDVSAGGGSHEYRVDVVHGGETSADSPTATVAVPDRLAWILDPADPEWGIPLAGPYEPLGSMGEVSEVFMPHGGESVVLVSQAVRGWEGTFTGTVAAGVAGISEDFATLRERVWRLKADPVKVWQLMVGAHSIPVVVRNVNIRPQQGTPPTLAVEFEYYQQGNLPWVA